MFSAIPMAEISQVPYDHRQPNSPKHDQPVLYDADVVNRFEKLFLTNKGMKEDSADRSSFLQNPINAGYHQEYPTGYSNHMSHVPVAKVGVQGTFSDITDYQRTHRPTFDSFKNPFLDSPYVNGNSYDFGDFSSNATMGWNNLPNYNLFLDTSYGGLDVQNYGAMSCNSNLRDISSSFGSGYGSSSGSSLNEYGSDNTNSFAFGGLSSQRFLKPINRDQNLLDKFQEYDLIELAKLKKGSEYLQKILATGDTTIVQKIYTGVRGSILDLMSDSNGFNVIKHCLKILNDKDYKSLLEPLYAVAIKNCGELASHVTGCCSINSLINMITDPERELLITKIAKKAVFLSQDPSGNYVLQNILNLQNQEFTDIICNELRGKFTRLSKMKCGSHVVEKCLQLRSSLILVVTELLESKEIPEVANDQYGNYVIQTALNELEIRKMDLECFSLYYRLVTSPAVSAMKFHGKSNGRRGDLITQGEIDE
ncbi:hypothetical protein GIB67_013369 [Kingdonia uniflora]|uniref:PUM-HD domain-containing protein n=1 Tax=Kingdonia uniflora TaxID=39325 RepID=A0A7J7LR45_9MAGN|nr:hypothetical protein GIB67_013369 [Kingdonia uniflora]